MLGANEALRRLKDELDLVDAQAILDSKAYVAMSARNPYLNFRPLSAYLRSEEYFELVATTPRFEYPKSKFDEQDELGFGNYMARDKPKDWTTIKERYTFLLTRIEETIKPYQDAARKVRYHWYNKNRTMAARHKIYSDANDALSRFKQIANSITEMMRQKVQLTDKAFIEISAEGGGLFINYPHRGKTYVPDVSPPSWRLSLRLVASMPTQVDEAHPLVAGVSNNLDSIKLSIPPEDPSIVTRIAKDKKKDPIYEFKVKDSGVDEQTLKSIIKFLLI
jgi:hypothetical protein